jgi:hypothetical protein
LNLIEWIDSKIIEGSVLKNLPEKRLEISEENQSWFSPALTKDASLLMRLN